MTSKKTNLKREVIDYPHFRTNLEVVYSRTLNVLEIFDIVSKETPILQEFYVDRKSTNESLTIPPTEETGLIVIFCGTSTISDLHHECTHITTHMFAGIDVEHTIENDEIYAYNSNATFDKLTEVLVKTFKIPKNTFFLGYV